MLKYNRLEYLPSSAELPDSDETPVDNELQISVPSLLSDILVNIWGNRKDWCFAINMGIYYAPKQPAIVPDAFLSLGVKYIVGESGRSSYVLWEENGILPILVLEVVSQTYNSEYEDKKTDYAELGILYYLVYAPTRLRRKHKRLELYRLVNGEYILQPGDKFWLPEIGLGIGRENANYKNFRREWLFWYDENGNRYLTPDEVKEQKKVQDEVKEQQMAQKEAQMAQKEAQMAQKEAQIAQEKQQIAQKEAQIAQKEAQIAQEKQQMAQEKQQFQEFLTKLKEMGIDPNTLLWIFQSCLCR